ncbi:MAG: 2-amino-4-hydroxy-6-hydroxymethyldihydropteridine diphosphokinase [Pirellulales bacterium]
MARCLIGCGSNLGERREQLDLALELLRFMPGVTFLAASRYRETPPVGGPSGQGTFLNGACLIETDLSPHAVLTMLTAVENTLHRERHTRWGERTIDLDLLLYGDLVVESDDLVVPHPRMATRRFVLEPSAEIAADLPYPLATCTVGDLLDNISVRLPLVSIVGVPGSGADRVAAAVADAVMGHVIHAPQDPPADAAGIAAWRRVLASWSAPLAREAWHDDVHPVAVADYWLDALGAIATERLPADEASAFHHDLATAAAETTAPRVAIQLVEPRDALAARDPSGELERLQERLSRRLRCPGERDPRCPKAVIAVDARDPARAVAEATAAVEAMH